MNNMDDEYLIKIYNSIINGSITCEEFVMELNGIKECEYEFGFENGYAIGYQECLDKNNINPNIEYVRIKQNVV